jgi:hypothetical protein
MALSDHTALLMLNQPCDQAVTYLTEQAKTAGLSVLRTFDLQIALNAQAFCQCPLHGTNPCDCQMVVLLVYSHHSDPLTIVAQGDQVHTWFSVVDTPQQRSDPYLEATIRRFIFDT